MNIKPNEVAKLKKNIIKKYEKKLILFIYMTLTCEFL